MSQKLFVEFFMFDSWNCSGELVISFTVIVAQLIDF